MTTEERRTWQEWDLEALNEWRILDPDGFRFGPQPADGLYSREEFLSRQMECTVCDAKDLSWGLPQKEAQ